MTRINTNVSSLQAQINLSRNNADLQTAMTRLSTGLRINSGKDDPAGLIASETLRSDINVTEVAISNCEMANQMIATADSALGEVSNLLLEIQSLINEAANSGTMSDAQIAANQLQIDSSLDAIDRISQIAQFQGSRLLDGSLDFITTGVNRSEVTNTQITQANFGTNSAVGVNVELVTQATKASLVYNNGQTLTDVVIQVGGTEGFQAFSFDSGTSVSDMADAINMVSDATGVTAVATGVLDWDASAGQTIVASYGANNDISITAANTGEAAGAYYVRYLTGGVGATTTANITQSEVDPITGAITYGYIDVTLGTSAATSAEFADITSGVPVQSLASGTFDLDPLGDAGTLNWTANAGFEGVLGAPTINITAYSDADLATFDASTNTYTVTFAAAASTGLALQTLLNGATGGQYTFSGGAGTAIDQVASSAGAIVVDGVNGAEAAFELNATTIATGSAGDAPFSIVFTNGVAADTYAAGVYTINIDNDGGDYSMTSQELRNALNAIAGRAHNFDIGTTTGTQLVNAGTQSGDWTMIAAATVTTNGSDGGTMAVTANEVVEAINTEQDAMITAGDIDARIFTVGNATDSDGTGVVAISEVTAVTGVDSGQDPTANNLLQYQALEGMRDIRYVAAGRNTALSIDLTSYEPEYANASAIIDLGFTNGTFELKSFVEGEDGNQTVAITWAQGAAESVTWDGTTMTITVMNDDSTTVNDIIDMINTSATTSGVFTADLAQVEVAPGTIAQVGDGTGTVDHLSLPTVASASLTGGVVSEGVLVVNLATDANGNVTTTANDLIGFINSSTEQVLKDFELQINNSGSSTGAGILAATTTDVKFDPPGTTYTDAYSAGSTHAANGSTARFTVTSKTAGTAYDGILVRVVNDTNLASGTGTVEFLEDSNTLLVSYNGSVTAEEVSYLINEDSVVGAMFTAEPTAGEGAGTGLVNDGDFVRLSGGETRTVPDPTTYTPPLTPGDPMVKLLGAQDAGEDVSNAMLTFTSANYGTKAFVSVKSMTTADFSVTNSAGTVADRSYGTDVNAKINGLGAVGDGLNASLSTSSLQLTIGLGANMVAGETTTFSITGGGAQFQIGTEVVSNQQARIGISSVNTATLGGNSGYLYQLRNGETHDLATDTTGAAAIVKDVITQITSLRGRLGAFQKTSLETTITTLEDTLETLTSAQSMIRDADFAAESSNLTRAQILVQSTTSILSIANQQPQNVLSLLQ